jgi:site-specific DNA recombinase
MNGNGDGNGKRAVLYARTSGDDRESEGRNLKSQLEMAREHAQRKGYTVVAEIAEDDRGVSGAAFELEGLNRVLEMAQAGEFDVLIPRELDRLSRSLAKQLVVEEELRRADVQIEYVLADYEDTPEGNLMKNVRAVVAEYERLKITERTTRARRRQVAGGSVMVNGHPPYGYRVVKDGDKWVLVIDESESEVVRSVFTWYTRGDGIDGPLSIRAITHRLEGIPTHWDIHGRSKQREWGRWNISVVHEMLKNETYAGIWRYGKTNPRRRARRNGGDHILTVEVPAIVDRETWEAAQARLAYNKENARRNEKHQYLLSKRVKCGRCGLKMSGLTSDFWQGKKHYHYQYYRCPATKPGDYARECDMPTFRADVVDAAVWDWIKSFLSDPVALTEGLAEYQAVRERESAPIRQRLKVVDDLVRENRQQLERLLDLYLSGDFPRELLTERKTRLEATIEALARERAGLLAHLEARTLTPGQMQSFLEFAAKVGQGLDLADANFETRRRVIEELDVQAVLTVEDAQKVAYVSCIIHPEHERLLCELQPVAEEAAKVKGPVLAQPTNGIRRGWFDLQGRR